METETELPEGEPVTAATLAELRPSKPTLWYDEKNGSIAIPVPNDKDPVTIYYVDLIRLMKPVNLIAWTIHLAGKPWMDRKRLREFMRLVSEVQRFKVPHEL